VRVVFAVEQVAVVAVVALVAAAVVFEEPAGVRVAAGFDPPGQPCSDRGLLPARVPERQSVLKHYLCKSWRCHKSGKMKKILL